MTQQRVSVVIPTVDRPAVRAAVNSALNQTYPPLEVIVVVDSAGCTIPPALRDISDKIRVFFAGGVGPSGARMRGIAEARGEIIALLDDDDEWLPEKLERQLALWPTESDAQAHTLMSCRLSILDHAGKEQKTCPVRVFSDDEPMPDYLFRRSSVAFGEGAMHPSSLMFDRALIDLEPWDSSLILHEDWDWLLRVGERSDVTIRMCPEPLVAITVADERSLSASADWRQSLNWLEQRADQLTPRQRGDFLLCNTAPLAFRSGNRRGGFIVATRALRTARPGHTAWLVWGTHMLSLKLINRASKLHSRITRNRPHVTEVALSICSDRCPLA